MPPRGPRRHSSDVPRTSDMCSQISVQPQPSTMPSRCTRSHTSSGPSSPPRVTAAPPRTARGRRPPTRAGEPPPALGLSSSHRSDLTTLRRPAGVRSTRAPALRWSLPLSATGRPTPGTRPPNATADHDSRRVRLGRSRSRFADAQRRGAGSAASGVGPSRMAVTDSGNILREGGSGNDQAPEYRYPGRFDDRDGGSHAHRRYPSWGGRDQIRQPFQPNWWCSVDHRSSSRGQCICSSARY